MMRAGCLLCLVLAGCVATPQPISVSRVVNECSWAPKITFGSSDTPETKREIIAYETARQKNCPG